MVYYTTWYYTCQARPCVTGEPGVSRFRSLEHMFIVCLSILKPLERRE